MKKILITCCLFYIANFSFAGSNTIDSLETAYKNAKHDTAKLKILPWVIWELKNSNPEKAIDYCKLAIELSEKLDSTKKKTEFFSYMGIIYWLKGDYSIAIEWQNKTLKLNEEINDSSATAVTLGNIGLIYKSMGDYATATDYTIRSLKILEQLKDDVRISVTYNNLGTLYNTIQNDSLALFYYNQSLEIRNKLNDRSGIASCLVNIGNIYFYNKDYKFALEYQLKALKIREEMGDKNRLALAYGNIGEIYSMEGKNDSALLFSFKSLKMREEIGDKNGIAYCLNNIGIIYSRQGKFDRALESHNIALEIAKNINSKEAIRESYRNLSLISVDKKDFKKAYEYHQLYSQMKDSLFNEESSKQITEMQTKYETEKKEQQIKLLNKDKEIQTKDLERQKTIRNAVAGGLLLVLLFSFILINRLLLIRKQKKLIEIEREKSEKLLLNILPKETADELKHKNTVTPKHYHMVTVMFTDFKGFTTIAEKMSAEELVAQLDFIFKKFDEIISKYPIEKIKTIGDAYMCAGGLPVANTTNPMDVVLAGLEISEFMKSRQEAAAGSSEERQLHNATATANWQIRIGIHTGSVIAGVVGDKKFAYDIWGDTVNTASRMESSGEPNKVNISGSTYELIKDKLQATNYQLQTIYRGKIPAKNKGEIEMYFAEKKSNL